MGVFAYTDAMAAEFVSLLLAHRIRVPENVAVLGVDNDDLVNRGLAIGLSSVASDQEGLGKAAGDLLREMLNNPEQAHGEAALRHPPKGVVSRRSTDYYAVRSPLVGRALRWIHDNLSCGFQAGDVAAALGVEVKIPHYPLWPLIVAGHFFEKICKPFKITPPIFPRRVDWYRQNRAFDISRARRDLGYEPRVDLAEGLRHTAEWYRAEGYLPPR